MKIFWSIGFTFLIGLAVAGLAAYGTHEFLLKETQSVSAPHKTQPKTQANTEAKPTKPALNTSAINAPAIHLASHKAVYQIDMVQKSSASQVLGIAGQMTFEQQFDCTAWTTHHHFKLTYDYADAPQMKLESDFITYEPTDGKSFDFNSRRNRDGERYEELRGHADMPSQPGETGKAVYTMPDNLDFTLPPGTLFPMAQTIAVLKAAHAGKKFLNAVVFDGSDQDGPTEVNTFIGPEIPPQIPASGSADSDNPKIDRSLVNVPSRLVRLAFFPLDKNEPDSDYEMTLKLYDNGVIGDMKVDYKDFSVTQKLIALQPVKAPTNSAACGSHAP